MIRCDLCQAGWVRSPTGFADPCRFCGGKQKISIEAIAEMIDENPETLRGLSRFGHKSRSKVAYRIFEKLMALISPPKQKELFE